MTWDTALALVNFGLVALWTPGPNNLMLMASGVNFGFVRTLPHIAGIMTGVLTLLMLTGFGVGTLLANHPDLKLGLKIVGGAFLLYLAWKIATARPKMQGEPERTHPQRFGEAAAFQLVNPKAWVLAITVMANFGDPERPYESVFSVIAIFLTMTLLSSTTWALGGTTLRGFLADPVCLKWFNRAMGMLLAATLWPLLK